MKNYPIEIGDIVTVTGILPDEPEPLEIGDSGPVTRVLYDRSGALMQLNVAWKSGRTLGLLPGDPFTHYSPDQNQE